MNLLDANDRRGEYPASYYAASAKPLAPFPVLRGQIKCDLCIVGGGYTGLSAALHAAQAGLDVVLLEAQRIGFGASGRNGGQVGSTFNLDGQELIETVGQDDASKLYALGHEAADLTRELAAAHAPDAGYQPGVIHADRFEGEAKRTRDSIVHTADTFGENAVRALDAEEISRLLGTEVYAGGALNMAGGHLHPLRYAFGLARACIAAGVRVFELSRVHEVASGRPAVVRTDQGQVQADHVTIGTNGYSTGLNRGTRARVMPINNFIVATEPLGDAQAVILSENHCAYDDRFVVNYFRKSEDGRLLFGGGESYGYRFPKDIVAKVRKPLEQVYPQLKGVKIDYAWGGTLAITMSRLPYLARPDPNVLVASGYSGSGVALATFAGKLMAEAVQSQSAGFDLLAKLPTPAFPGGGALRTPLLALAMTWFAMRDRLGV
ncbi:MAG: FAD-binding oxidoreductase [Litoreibacter sp.]|nr:FAD-binding oxidoreductase [Litoreibacter sp.]